MKNTITVTYEESNYPSYHRIIYQRLGWPNCCCHIDDIVINDWFEDHSIVKAKAFLKKVKIQLKGLDVLITSKFVK